MRRLRRVIVKKLVVVLAVVLFFAAVEGVKASMTISTTVLDVNGNDITGTTVPVGTAVNVTGTYVNPDGNMANATLDEYFSVDNTTFALTATLFNGEVSSGQTINVGPYVLTNVGYYQFWWTCVEIIPGDSSCNNGADQMRVCMNTYLSNVVPEPAPLIGGLMGILALGVFFLGRKTVKSPKLDYKR